MLYFFQIGDYVLHEQYGVGKFCGIEFIKIQEDGYDFLKIEYANCSFIFIPTFRMSCLKFFAPANSLYTIEVLGKSNVLRKRRDVIKQVQENAQELIKMAALRDSLHVDSLTMPSDYCMFAAGFEFDLTNSQTNAIAEIFEDLALNKPMDRLLCADVGFGKTEVALRAIFLAVKANKQVLFIVPTTILGLQHYELLQKRFLDFGKSVAFLSRLTTNPKEIKEKFSSGSIDILVLTATQKNIAQFLSSKIGLIVLDEEHHFGAQFKETLRNGYHLLQLSATPIPRTLNLALSKIKQMSFLEMPPIQRQSTKIHVVIEEELKLQDLIEKELKNNGKIFIVVPRINFIWEVQQLITQFAYVILNGQQTNEVIQKNLQAFKNGEVNILIGTTIIESGLNIVEANLMIIFKAHLFGVAQLHQLKGRIGRLDQQAHLYLVIPKILKEIAQERINLLQNNQMLGAGLNLAMQDMGVRGAGTALGYKQSGKEYSLGVEAYYELFAQALENKDLNFEKKIIQVDFLGFQNAYIPVDFVNDEQIRMNFYKKLSAVKKQDQIAKITEELMCFGELSPEIHALLEIAALNIRVHHHNSNSNNHIKRIRKNFNGLQYDVTFTDQTKQIW